MPLPANTHTPETLLRSVFGYDTFRTLQREVIDNVLAKNDTLAIMPTGGGKSLCYQIPALLFPGLTVVVSPLISLMQDQVAQLNALGVPAVVLNSSLDWETYTQNMARVRQGKVKLLYAAPETLLTDRLEYLLQGVKVDLLTIDEAHCISEWGHDFRPEYRTLVEVRRRHPTAACLALTATATERVRSDIQNALEFKQASAFLASFNRPNLFLEVQPKQSGLAQLLAFLKDHPRQSGIIYCFSRKQVDTIAEELQNRGYSARPYHAGLSDETRRINQEAFVRDDVQIMAATIAFGMGINKPNVRFVVHYDLPRNVESYYQEIGRAGRDGLPAHCLLLYSYGDTKKIEYFIQEKAPAEQTKARQHLRAMVDYAEAHICRRIPLLKYFGEKPKQENCSTCDICTGQRASVEEDLTTLARLWFNAIVQTGERFGAAHLTDVLLGVNSEKVIKFDHQNLPCFGKGGQLTSQGWMDLSRQLEQKGFLARTEHQGLRLTSQASQALVQNTSITGAPISAGTGAKTRKSRSASARLIADSSPTKGIPVLDYDIELFDLLRQKRKDIADHERLPPYMILPDRSLVEMATRFPMSVDGLKDIYGFGEVKLEKFGAAFVQVIQQYGRRKVSG